MKTYWVKTPRIIKKLFSDFVWDMPAKDKIVYLTFDDGPTPEITQWVLSQLEKHQAKATFFCIGNNIAKHTDLFENVIKAGHAVGNHTFDHLNGWKTQTNDYIADVKMCANEMPHHVRLFRPPYGRLKRSQTKKLRNIGYRIIMWDVLSADFDQTISPEKCLENVLKNVSPGSIVIFHDSVKAHKNLEYVLPRALDYLAANGYRCEKLA
ncbi:MAG: polysaccharide deacetylase family protein [Flavobacterium sp.]|nr:MAG: polysaccharide deacetylase family protein [Flavobacterium sp.]